MDIRIRWKELALPTAMLAMPIPPGLALATGAGLAALRPAAVPAWGRRVQKLALQGSVILLGLAMDPGPVAHAAIRGLALSAATLVGVFALGFGLAAVLEVPSRVASLVCAGTAICGGSAIAAAGAAMESTSEEMGTALGAVFLLNAVGLYLFPAVAHHLGLDATTFGTWSGLALHDLSSVVGAASQGGSVALQAALSTKLARTLWIAPTGLLLGLVFHSRRNPKSTRPPLPWFLLGFFGMASLRWLFPSLAIAGPTASWTARKGMTLALFLVGTGLTPESIRRTGPRPLVLAVLLWIVVAVGSLVAIR